MNDTIFSSNTEGVGQQRDFYRIQELTNKDVDFIRAMAIGSDQGLRRDIHEQILQNYIAVSQMIKISSILKADDKKLADMGNVLQSNFMEDCHSDVENMGISYINSLANGDSSFLNNTDSFINFSRYICTQFLRTRKRKEEVLSLATPIDEGTVSRTWPLISYMVAINIAHSMFCRRNEYHIEIIENLTVSEFITSDQPVVNTLPAGETPQQNTVEFYYPITPRLAILFGNKNTNPIPHRKITTNMELKFFNELITKNSHMQLFASTEDALLCYKAAPKPGRGRIAPHFGA